MIVAQTGWICVIVVELRELFGTRVKTIQAALPGANPEIALLIFDNGCNPTVT